jgi:cation diffusion facilitator CzcD-associated flavoprotein CzcO
MQNETALSALRAYNGYLSDNEGLYPSLLRRHYDNKDISVGAIRAMRRDGISLGTLLRITLLRGLGRLSIDDARLIMVQSLNPGHANHGSLDEYDGSPEQNKVLDQSLTIYNSPSDFVGESAMSTFFNPDNLLANAPDTLKGIPIAVIGRGAAGTMIALALRRIGFRNVKLFDKRGSPLGIWGQSNVAKGTKNNPRSLSYNGLATLDSAKGDGLKDGASVAGFITNLSARMEQPEIKRNVTAIEARDLKNIVRFEENGQASFEEFPIVINCIGTGKPRPLSNGRMKHLGKERIQAIRWQQQLEREDVEGLSIAIIGLGNSTAEMMSQLNELRAKGADCDYRILTHFPEDAVLNPNDTVHEGGKNYRVFRDLSKPDLTSFHGDLPRSRQDYFQALREERIRCGVKKWSVDGGEIEYLGSDDGSYSFDKLYVLTGYEQDRELLSEKFSINFYSDGGPIADYDGEFRDDAGDISKGYFGLGALMDSEHDPNAVVIPGMMFRMPDMIFTIICRAYEVEAARRAAAVVKPKAVVKADDLLGRTN